MESDIEAASEVARLMKRISAEHEAACFALTGLAEGVSKHWFITRRMERIGVHQEQLARIIGEETSIALVAGIMENSPAQKRESHG